MTLGHRQIMTLTFNTDISSLTQLVLGHRQQYFWKNPLFSLFPTLRLGHTGERICNGGKTDKICAEFGYPVIKFISSAARGSRDLYVGHRSQAMTA